MDNVNKNIIWRIIRWLLYCGIAFLFLVSFQRTSRTEEEVKEDLESIPAPKEATVVPKRDSLVGATTALFIKQNDSINKIKSMDAKAHNIVVYQYKNQARLYLITLGTALLIAFSCMCIGALIGFIFGIPRIKTAANDQDAEKRKTMIFHNDNLVEISDWLTKIIVGVGLTQINAIPEVLDRIGRFLGPSFTTNIENVKLTDGTKAIAISVVLYFLILGFMACYLWTRFQFSSMLKALIKEEETAAMLHNSGTTTTSTPTPPTK